MTADKIQREHLERRACVYLRQSTMAQLVTHSESTARQYALRKRAIELGWTDEQVDVIDEDLGRSGRTTDGRSGFQRLAEDVAHGRIGAIFAIEVSRLARSSADWHRLLELCSLADVVIADESALYRPHADYNDRILLGFKGQMSEAESYWMRLRLHGAKLSKARRGALKFRLPPAFVWSGDKIAMTPDEGIRKTIALVFERFRIDGTINGVARYFRQHGIRVPCQNVEHLMRWEEATFQNVGWALRNPLYAGAYVWGRRANRVRFVDGKPQLIRSSPLPIESWAICLRDSHPGYISWDEFLDNQRKLKANMNRPQYPEQRGAPRNGIGLLQGLAICGRCGERMRTRYLGRTNICYYVCERGRRRGAPGCWTVGARTIDEAIEQLFLQTMQPAEIDLSLAILRQTEQQATQLDKHWELRIERARYEARQAERRYQLVDPENRLVARTLEHDWEDKLRSLTEVEQECEETRRRQHLVWSNEERDAVLALAKDLPRVWRASTTMPADQKNLLRMVIREVVLSPIDLPARKTSIRVIWQTGFVSNVEVTRPSRGLHIRTPPAPLAAIRELTANGVCASEIARRLNADGLRSGTGKPWTSVRVNAVRHCYGFRTHAPTDPLPEQRIDGAYSVRGLAKRLGVSDRIIYAWQRTGVLHGERKGKRDAWWFPLDEQAIAQLEARRR